MLHITITDVNGQVVVNTKIQNMCIWHYLCDAIKHSQGVSTQFVEALENGAGDVKLDAVITTEK